MNAPEHPAAQAIFADARIEAVLADVHGVAPQTMIDLLQIAYVELACLLAELENPTPAGIGERRDNVVRLIADMMRVGNVS